jgi:hypothetical protein
MEPQQHEQHHAAQHAGQGPAHDPAHEAAQARHEAAHAAQSDDWLAGATLHLGQAPVSEHQLMVAADELPPLPDGDDHGQLA